MQKKPVFINQHIYHVFNKSIANFGIFKNHDFCYRFIQTVNYYNNQIVLKSFSEYLEKNKTYEFENLLIPKAYCIIKILSYCIMPDHYHLLIKILSETNISQYISNIENSYTRYFNIRMNRKGPLWQSRFKAVRIKTNQQFLHTHRYIHLNPTTSNLVETPEDWEFSSYKDFITDEKYLKDIVTEISIRDIKQYKKFVDDQKDYQRKLKLIKKLIIE